MTGRLLRAALALTLVLLLVAVAVLVGTRRQVTRLSAEAEDLREELYQTQAELAEADEAEQEQRETGLGQGLGELLGGLLGGEGADGLEGLLQGGSGAALAGCVAGAGGGPVGLGQGAEPIPPVGASEQIAEITERVEALRELERTEELDVAFLTTAEIERRVTDLVLADYPAEEADVDRRLYEALGAIPPGQDLRAVQAELVSGQVAGYYEPESGELVVRADDPGQPLGPTEQVTLAHEIEHALADQVHGLDLEDPDQPTDAARAELALVEGDATLTMQRFSLGALELTDQLALAADPDVLASQQQLEGFPHVLAAPLLFSYTAGMAFVCGRHADGGWGAVDAAYERPPQTTAEILFPARYPLEPVEPRAPGAPGGGWREVRRDTFGAADLLWLFEAPGDDEAAALDDPRGRAEDWAGGSAVVSTDGDATAVGIALEAVAGRGPALCHSVRAWWDAAFAGREPALACIGDEVRLGIAPDDATARALTR